MNAQWKRLNAATAAFMRTPSSRKNSVEIYPSPFQVPDAFRIEETEDGAVHIELRYLDSGEPTICVNLKDGTTVRVGRNSGRVFEIMMPRSVLEEAVRKSLAQQAVAVNAIEELSHIRPVTHNRWSNVTENFRITSRLIEEGSVPLPAS